jgi:hypothetical protein
MRVAIEQHAIRVGNWFAVSFQRTLRIPDDGRAYPLPPGLGAYPVVAAAEHDTRLPSVPQGHAVAIIPMYQREALWLGFDGPTWRPHAVKVGVGRIDAVSGAPWRPGLTADPQDYLVCPPQLWLDGVNTGTRVVRQFVAMPLGQGATIEAALTGTEEFGGIQIAVHEARPGRFPDAPPAPAGRGAVAPVRQVSMMAMGLGAGGTMRQKIYPDPHGIDTWDPERPAQVTVHIVNSAQFRELTGVAPPPSPISAQTYTDHGLPWFALYDDDMGDVPASERLRDAATIADQDRRRGERRRDEPVDIPDTQITTIDPKTGRPPDPRPADRARPQPE